MPLASNSSTITSTVEGLYRHSWLPLWVGPFILYPSSLFILRPTLSSYLLFLFFFTTIIILVGASWFHHIRLWPPSSKIDDRDNRDRRGCALAFTPWFHYLRLWSPLLKSMMEMIEIGFICPRNSLNQDDDENNTNDKIRWWAIEIGVMGRRR